VWRHAERAERRGRPGRLERDELRCTAEHPRRARIIARDLRDAGMRRVLGTPLHSTRHRMDRRLPAVRAPTLVLRGEHDPIAPPRWVAQAAVLAPHGRCGVVAGPVHNAMTTAGPQVAARAAAFLPGTPC
jgi:pimeloyl-ACP methyl ester carboxylesterase